MTHPALRTRLLPLLALLSLHPLIAAEPQTFPLWPDQAPLGDGTTEPAKPTLTLHRPATPNGTAIIICPGGGYGGLVTGPEGHHIAKWLNQHHITGLVLEYRLPAGRHQVPLLDAQRAIRLARENAADWSCDPARIGIIGFSAGGHLAATAATRFDPPNSTSPDPIQRHSSRPDFAVLIYPVITMGEGTHGGSRKNLLGENPSPELIQRYSAHLQVTSNTPPAYLAHAIDDHVVPCDQSRKFHAALNQNKIPNTYLELPSGDHGLNGYQGPMWDAWQSGMLKWLISTTTPKPQPKLQIFNDSNQPAEIFWLKSPTERVPNGNLKPGENTIISTHPGHTFLVVGTTDKSEIQVTSQLLHQAAYFNPDSKENIPSFYTQIHRLRGFPIVASATVNPYALKEAAFIGDLMLANRPDVLQAMTLSGARLSIMAHNEFTTDLPEFTRMTLQPMPGFEKFTGKEYWDARARGTGGSTTDPICTCAEENVLGYPGDPYESECILIHEFAHNIHLRGLNNVDPTFDPRLKQTYESAMKKGLWKGKYASVNHHEYFAEGVQSWFDDNRENDHDHNHVNTRKELIAYDPDLAALCREVFGNTEFQYTKPATRLHGHLAGYDPSTAPTFVWPERFNAVREAIKNHAKNR
jgi:acetyl esterase/lipase